MICLLSVYGIRTSVGTLNYCLKECGRQQKLAQYNKDEVRQRIQEVSGPGSIRGYRSV